jgi:hypothetical protein
MKILTGLISILVIGCSDTKPKEEKHILDLGYFTIETPKDWTSKIGYSTFAAEAGEIMINTQDTLNLYISSIFENSLTETDSVIIYQNKIPPFKPNYSPSKGLIIDSVKPVDLDKYRKNNISWDTIDGLKAKIIFPRQTGIGTTGVYFEKIPDNYNSLVLYGENLEPANEKLLLQALKTIKFTKK